METRNFENAVAFLMRRARRVRPTYTGQARQPRSILPNGAPDLRGRPAIHGMRDWLLKLGYSDAQIGSLNIIHVAGTKGKGSTCAFAESLLRLHGKKTGLYTSPHLLQINERIRINFTPISEDLFARYVYDVRDRLGLDDDTEGPRYLQLLALVSFHAFIQQDVDVAIYETHHGGEFDATNVIPHPIVTAITSIGIDHIVDLGPTIENIAWHKAGIFKSGSPAISAPQQLNVAKVLTDRAAEKGVQLTFIEADPALPDGFASHVQRLNCSLARAACDEFLKRRGAEGQEKLSERVIAEAIRRFQWPGRFQQMQEGPCTWYLDGAHNELSICEAVNWFQQTTSKHDVSSARRILIFAQNSDNRDGEAVLRSLTQAVRVPFHRAILTTYCETDAECTTEEMEVLSRYQQIWAQLMPETPISVTRSVMAAIAVARDAERDMAGNQILVTGSLYLVGAVLRRAFQRGSS